MVTYMEAVDEVVADAAIFTGVLGGYSAVAFVQVDLTLFSAEA